MVIIALTTQVAVTEETKFTIIEITPTISSKINSIAIKESFISILYQIVT